jgi:hypothetical protein
MINATKEIEMHIPFSNLSLQPTRGLLSILREGGQTLCYFTLLGLMVFGLVAFAYTTLSPNGWLQSLLAQLWAVHPVGAIVTAVGMIVLIAMGMGSLNRRALNERIGDWLTYACLGSGIYFAAKLAMTGTL